MAKKNTAPKTGKLPQDMVDPEPTVDELMAQAPASPTTEDQAPSIDELMTQAAPELEELVSQEAEQPLPAIPIEALTELVFVDQHGLTYQLDIWRAGGIYILRPYAGA